MKKAMSFSVVALILAGCASSGTFIRRSTFTTQAFVSGIGKSKEEAKQKALSSIPTEYEVEGSGVSGCASPKDMPTWDKKTRQYICPSQTYSYEVGLLPKDMNEKSAELDSRMKTRQYIGYGDTHEEAKKSAIAQMPPGAVFTTTSWGCANGGIENIETGGFTCHHLEGKKQRQYSVTVYLPNTESLKTRK